VGISGNLFHSEASAAMTHTLVHLQQVGNGRFDPKSLVSSLLLDISYLARCFYNTGEHKGYFWVNFGLNSTTHSFFPIFASQNHLKEYNMLIIDSKDCENIDKALKKYKKKFEKAKVLLQLRSRQSFTKPSIKRRGEVLKAVYKQQLAAGKFD
jgi:small subunit ribosomal protein S21